MDVPDDQATPEPDTGPTATPAPTLEPPEADALGPADTSAIGSFQGAGANREPTGGSARVGFTRTSHTPRPPV